MGLITMVIDDIHYKIEEGKLLLDVLNDNGIDIPYFCYHEALGSDGNCRMCMVEIEGKKRPQIACDTFVNDGMVVRTQGEKINSVRKRILELELINHPVDCPICDQAGECKLQDFYMDYGLYDSAMNKEQKVTHKKHLDLGSNVILDQERCVLCARCTRFTSNITKTGELGIVDRGDHASVSTLPGAKLSNPYAMNIVDICPVGALTSKDFRFAQRVWFLTPTESICQGCAKGCNIYIDHNKQKYQEDTIYRFRPRINKKINGHFMCDEGRLSFHELQANRQKQCSYKNDTINADQFLEKLQEKINQAKTTLILINPNLYQEDIAAIVAFAQNTNATVISPTQYYYDETFGDDWLKSPWRCSNKGAIEDLNISQEMTNDFYELLINFNHPQAKQIHANEKVSFQTHIQTNTSDTELIAPIPVYSEQSGTLINKDRIKQYANQAIIPKEPIFSISQWLHKLQEKSS
jgi:NADH-quinone oxidoreductase subunit G